MEEYFEDTCESIVLSDEECLDDYEHQQDLYDADMEELLKPTFND